jgi:hypothetical protein
MSEGLPYVYFVSYAHGSGAAFGYGNVEIKTEFLVASFEQVRKIEEVITGMQRTPTTIVVLGYQLLSGPNGIGGEPR